MFFFFTRRILSFSLNWIILLCCTNDRNIVLKHMSASTLEWDKFYHLNDIISSPVINHLFFYVNFSRFHLIGIQQGKFNCFCSIRLPDFSLDNLSTFGRTRTLSSKSLYSGDLEKRGLANSQLQLRGITTYVCKKNIHISKYDITCYMQITSILGHYFHLKVLIIFQETSHEFSINDFIDSNCKN